MPDIPHIVIEVRGGVVQFVDGFNGAWRARAAYPLLKDNFTEEPKTGVRYVVLDHDDLEDESYRAATARKRAEKAR